MARSGGVKMHAGQQLKSARELSLKIRLRELVRFKACGLLLLDEFASRMLISCDETDSTDSPLPRRVLCAALYLLRYFGCATDFQVAGKPEGQHLQSAGVDS